MNKIFVSTFVTLFLAEMGDKTQLAAFSLSAKTGQPWTVFIAASLALACVTLIGVFAGKLVGQYFTVEIMRWVSGGLFVAVGAFILIKG